ncbi:MAG: hypothetical protein WC831_01080 [Parcubacteria group bacterium]|jgi:hypothetical protein
MTQDKFFYRLTKDLLISLVITYFLSLIPELILPGVVSSHFNPKYLLFFILILGIVFFWLGKKYPVQEKLRFRAISKNLLNFMLFVVMVMLALSLYKMKIWQILIVLVLSLVLLISAEKMLVPENNEEQ